MIVLGYLSRSNGNAIRIPPFHTGHLGLLPDTEVNLYFIAPHDSEHTNCEVLISPMHRSPDRLMQITCVMDDKPGVVSHLIAAVSALHLNIISQESSAINHMRHHVVDLLVDWSQSSFPDDSIAAPSSLSRRYRDYDVLFPVRSRRCIALFNSIVAHCADVLACESSLPRVHFRTVQVPKHEVHYGTAVIERAEERRFVAKCTLPDALAAQIRQRLGVEPDTDIGYVLLSDTEDRILRVFFPKPEIASTLVHVGIRHNDSPGALAAIAPVIANANFNVLTSLLRKKNRGKNVWEAVLEYRGAVKVPQQQGGQAKDDFLKEVVDWVAAKFVDASRTYDIDRIRNADLSITPPEYPRAKENYSVDVKDKLAGKQARNAETKSIEEMLVERVESILEEPDSPTFSSRQRLIETVKGTQRWQPRVFLSYPQRAKEHGQVTKEWLAKEGYTVDEYQIPRGEFIVEEVIDKIDSCDVFVGIWHHEDGMECSTISPWMPFEYGIARAFQRECVIVHSKKLDPSVWQRISPEVAHAGYSDVRFETETVPVIIANVKRHAPLTNR